MFYAYIVYSPSLDSFYVGQTDNLPARLEEHCSHVSRFTSRAEDWTYGFYQGFKTRAEVVRLERRIKKSKSRKSLLRYIRHSKNQCSEPFVW